MTRFFSIALVLAGASLSIGCPSSGTIATAPSDAGTGDDAAVVIPPTAACEGDPLFCLSGSMTVKGFVTTFQAAKVELYRVFPNGALTPLASNILAKDGKFAFSNLAPWGHYYLRGVVRIGDPKTGASVATTRGRFAVPITAGTTFDLTVIPVQLELLESAVGGNRALEFVSAHVFDPATGKDLTDAIVTFEGTASPTPMPFTTNASKSKSYYVAFNPPVTTTGAFSIVTSHAALGATPLTWDMTPEASIFDGALTSPKEGGTIAVNMPLDVTWPAQPGADYTLVELFAKSGAGFTATYASPATIAADVSKETIPAASIAAAGSYLLNVDLAQARCQLGTSQGCTYLIHPATANLTAQ